MAAKKMTERLALPMFVCGIIAMISSAGVSLGVSANATSPIEYKKVTMTYLSSDFSAMDSSCGSAQDLYYGNGSNASFRAKSLRTNSSDKTFLCTASFYVVTNVTIPTPKPLPTITVKYTPAPSASPRPTKTIYVTPTQTPRPRPTQSSRPTQSPKPTPTRFVSPTPKPRPSVFTPRPSPTSAPRN